MALPNNETFEQMLRTLSVDGTPPDSGAQSIAVAARRNIVQRSMPETVGPLASVPTTVEGEVRLWYSPPADLTMDALLRRVASELRAVHHAVPEVTSKLVLALYTRVRRPGQNAVQEFNALLSQIATADVSQFAISPISVKEFRFEIGPFAFGPLDLQKVRERCRRANSDFFARHQRELSAARYAIERSVFHTPCIPWISAFTQPIVTLEGILHPLGWEYRLIDEYFSCLYTAVWDNFWDDLNHEQQIPTAAGASFVDEAALRRMPWLQLLTLFLNIGPKRWGWVLGGVQSQVLPDFEGTARDVPQLTTRLREEFGMSKSNDSAIHGVIDKYSHFVATAARYERDGRASEAFVHFVISLDLLLGGSESTSKNVSRRAAALVLRPLQTPYEQVLMEMRDMYGARSKYVHEGKSVPDKWLRRIFQVCQQVLFCLLRFQRTSQAQKPDAIVHWQRQLDYVASALEAGRELPESDWDGVGVDTENGSMGTPGGNGKAVT